MSGAVEKVKECMSKLEEIKMKTAATAAADLAKEAMKVPSPKDLNEAVKDPKAAKMLEHPEAQKDATEIDPMAEINKSNAVKSAKEKAEAALKEKQATIKKARLEAAHKAYKQRVKARADAAVKARIEAKSKAEKQMMATLKKELRIMATLEPKKFATYKKHAKLAKVCAEVEKAMWDAPTRAKVRAELDALHKTDPKAAESARKELMFVAPEILMEEGKDGEANKNKEHAKDGKDMHASADQDPNKPLDGLPGGAAPATAAGKENDPSKPLEGLPVDDKMLNPPPANKAISTTIEELKKGDVPAVAAKPASAAPAAKPAAPSAAPASAAAPATAAEEAEAKAKKEKEEKEKKKRNVSP